MNAAPSMPRTDRTPAILLFIGSGALLVGAYGFQYFGDLQPCVLCLYQRAPHAVVLSLMVMAMVVAPRHRLTAGLLGLAGLVLLGGAGIAGFHVGVEMRWWEGTAECGSTVAGDTVAALRAQLLAQPVVRCDEVAWSLFGVSMAGYNLAFSAALAIFALRNMWSRVRGSVEGVA
jgi:disulfide bond formation protein DsbB